MASPAAALTKPPARYRPANRAWPSTATAGTATKNSGAVLAMRRLASLCENKQVINVWKRPSRKCWALRVKLRFIHVTSSLRRKACYELDHDANHVPRTYLACHATNPATFAAMIPYNAWEFSIPSSPLYSMSCWAASLADWLSLRALHRMGTRAWERR